MAKIGHIDGQARRPGTAQLAVLAPGINKGITFSIRMAQTTRI
jgi:hypothetical protein